MDKEYDIYVQNNVIKYDVPLHPKTKYLCKACCQIIERKYDTAQQTVAA